MEDILIPNIYCPFPAQTSPYFEQLYSHTLIWVEEFHLFHKHLTEIPRFVSVGHPKENLEELLVTNDWYIWAFVYDDRCDDGELSTQPEVMDLLHERLLAAIQAPASKTFQDPLVAALSDVWQRACRLTSPAWQQRFAQHHTDWFVGSRREAEHRAQQRFPDLHAYMHSTNPKGATACFDLIELAGRIELPIHVYNSPPFQAIIQAAFNIMVCINDVFSFKKELAHSDVNNLVLILQRTQGCSFQSAVNQVCTTIEVETRRFQDMVQSFPAFSSEIDRTIRSYLLDLGIWIRANLDWSLKAARYQVAVSHQGK